MAHPDHQSLVARRRPREVWPDSAKGICIVLVVLYHVVDKQYVLLDWQIPGLLVVGWDGFSSLMTPIRMPLFFAISGYFSAAYLARPWPSVVKRRLVPVYSLYVLWLTLHSMLFLIVPSAPTVMVEGVGGYLLALVLGYTSLWYLYALPAYLLIAKLCYRAPRTSLAVAVAVSALSAALNTPSIGNSVSLFRNFVFFLGGVLLTHWMARLARRHGAVRLAAWTGVFVAVSGAHSGGKFFLQERTLAADLGMAVLQLAASVLGVVVGVALVSSLARGWRRPAAVLAWIGRRTLPVYVLHLPLLALANLLLSGTSIPLSVAVVYPVVATVCLVLACVGLSSFITAIGGGWLFEPQSLWRRGRSEEPTK